MTFALVVVPALVWAAAAMWIRHTPRTRDPQPRRFYGDDGD